MSLQPEGVDAAEFEQAIRDLKHDFRSQLWIVSFCLEQLQKDYRDALDPEMMSFVDGSVEAVQEMRNLLDGLSRFDSRRND